MTKRQFSVNLAEVGFCRNFETCYPVKIPDAGLHLNSWEKVLIVQQSSSPFFSPIPHFSLVTQELDWTMET